MKKIFFTLSYLLAIILSSCNDDNKIETPKENQNTYELNLQLKEYNNNFFQDNKFVETRSWKSFLNFLCSDSFGADYGGKCGAQWGRGKNAYKWGSLIGGILCSVIYAIVNNDYQTKTELPIIYNDNNEWNYIGEIHNEVLNHILLNKNKYLNNDNSIKKEILYLDIENKIKEYNIIDKNDANITIISSKKSYIFNFFQEIQTIQNTYKDEKVAINKVYDILIQKFPAEEVSLNINREYLLNATNISDEAKLQKYANGYENIIIASNINEDIKAKTLAPIALSKNSQAYWMSNAN